MSEPVAPSEPGSGRRRAPVVLLVAFLVALGLLIISSIVDVRNANDLEESNANVSQAIAALDKVRTVANTLFIAESSERGYLLTGNAAYLDLYRDMQQRLEVRLADLDRSVAESASQRAAAAELRTIARRRFDEMQQALDAYGTGGSAAAMAVINRGEGLQTMSAARDVIGRLLGEESRMLVERRAVAASTYSGGLVRALAATIVVGVALTVFYFLMRRYLRQRDDALRTIEATNAELEQRVIERTADLSHLSRHLLDVREHEKKAIARDLHDDFGSYLTAINMDVSRARDKIAATNPEQAAKLDRTLGLLNSAIELKRQLISELRPSMLDNLGLGPALEQYVEAWSRRSSVQADFDHHGELQSDDEGCLIAIFRVFQEALTNIARHSQATRVAAYTYRTGDEIEFEIADNGVGIAESDRGKAGTHGLLGIRERVLAYGGKVEIVNGPTGGTVLRGSMPCHAVADVRREPYVAQFA